MSVDWENLEVWIGAYFMEDKALQEILEAGTNFHDFNTEVFFKIKKLTPEEEKDPANADHLARWNKLRKAAKVIVFARINTRFSINSVNSGNAEMPILSQAS